MAEIFEDKEIDYSDPAPFNTEEEQVQEPVEETPVEEAPVAEEAPVETPVETSVETPEAKISPDAANLTLIDLDYQPFLFLQN